MTENTVLILASIGVLSLACQWAAWRLRIPAILLLLGSGMLVGPLLGWLDPQDLFGSLLFPLISLAVAVILFEGSLTLRFEDIGVHGKVVRNLIPLGAVATSIVGTLAAHWALSLSWAISLLFGAIIVVTGPTVVGPLLRSVRPTSRLSNILRWEGILIDPVGALLAVLVFEGIVSLGHDNVLTHTLATFGLTLFSGLCIGSMSGWLLGLALRRHLLPHYLQNAATLTFMLGVYALSNTLSHESGLLTVTIMGLWLANMKNVPVDDILEFKESLSVLLLSALFIILAARIRFHAIAELGWGFLWVLLAILLIARPISVWLAAIGSDLDWRDKAFLSWVAPRGIVAAAVSTLFTYPLQKLGYSDAPALVPLVFMVIIATVTLQSLTARPMARLLKVLQPANNGFLILGANQVARQVASALAKREISVTLTDTNWENLRLARMDNLNIYFGNPASEHASNHLDLTGIGNVLIISPYKQLNSLATYHFLDWFGNGHVFSLSEGDQEQKARHQTAEKIQQTRGLFGEGITYAKLASMVSQGYTVKSTQLTESFTYEDWLRQHNNKAIPLFIVDGRKRVLPVMAGKPLKPEQGKDLISLVPPGNGKEREKERGQESQAAREKAAAAEAYHAPAEAGGNPATSQS
ncbi:cation:proton antiporter [Mangrovitalea sediminis]|uniref:cation:proton antiporter n=1 Tax=Mangrovitalea sediminis TaxID=1982043 RepID=UPI000BE61E82|nr:sodium:proton antiporter [Mangrovitalea sediminis]